ncbi:glutamine synthetase III [Helcococcus ovis]|uniref:glutamine synthetase III n=2 Tax=Helcococcus ovis TaxID=72026 RepID=UPI0038BCE039
MDFKNDFGVKTFGKKNMKKYLPEAFYIKWKNSVRKKSLLDKETADVIAASMKEWAIANGAKYFCHWFQPLNGLSAKKLESFLDRRYSNEVIIKFSGKELIKSEPDASSFPSGGMRSTFEARGYTYWDLTSNTFIIDETLYIPSIFVSFNGQTLDKKGPLLRSMDFVGEYATKLVNLFSKNKIYRVRVKVGLEQEFFLIDKEMFYQRRDLVNAGRTLIGASPIKAQEFSDYYYGLFPQRVEQFYKDLNIELEKLGIYPKTEHNEVAPCQFEIAVLFENANIAVDNNLIVMQILKSVAKKNDLECLLNEKPFNHVNGSGKHNNWSIVTNNGINCLESGKTELEQVRYLLFMCAIIESCDKYPELLRLFSSCPGNDYRLGADEAPPAIISIFLGKPIEKELYNIAGLEYELEDTKQNIVINNLGYTPFDNSDRNRTSPFAYTGNKFEFRMLGSSMNASDVNTILNTSIGDSLKNMYEKLKDSSCLINDAKTIAKEILTKHSRILFSGDGYSKEWIDEAERRGLPNISTFIEAIPTLLFEKNIALLENNGIYKKEEIIALHDIFLENAINTFNLEIKTFVSIVDREIVPSIMDEINDISTFLLNVENKVLRNKLDLLSNKLEFILEENIKIKEGRNKLNNINDKIELSYQYFLLNKNMINLRNEIDELESYISLKNTRLPNYEMIFSRLDYRK